MSERTEREFQKWKENYIIPFHEEFNVKTLIGLQEEYENTEVSSNTTKTRDSILSMVNNVSRNLRLETLKSDTMKNKKYLIITNREKNGIKELLEQLIEETSVKAKVEGYDYYKIQTSNNFTIEIVSSGGIDKVRGSKYHRILNFTDLSSEVYEKLYL